MESEACCVSFFDGAGVPGRGSPVSTFPTHLHIVFRSYGHFCWLMPPNMAARKGGGVLSEAVAWRLRVLCDAQRAL